MSTALGKILLCRLASRWVCDVLTSSLAAATSSNPVASEERIIPSMCLSLWRSKARSSRIIFCKDWTAEDFEAAKETRLKAEGGKALDDKVAHLFRDAVYSTSNLRKVEVRVMFFFWVEARVVFNDRSWESRDSLTPDLEGSGREL